MKKPQSFKVMQRFINVKYYTKTCLYIKYNL